MIEFTEEKLNELKNVDISKVDINTLVDIREVEINQELSLLERMSDYITQIGNPYCYRYGDYVVKICFSDTNITLEERLKEALSRTATLIST